jgi:hypothetical protein
MNNDIPCRVSADLRALDRQQTAAALDAPEFGYLEEDFRHIVPKELAPLFERLYATYSQINAIQGSFGEEAVDAKQALGWLLEDLARMEEEILTLWENA